MTQYANQPSAADKPEKVFTGEEAWLLFAKVSFREPRPQQDGTALVPAEDVQERPLPVPG